MLVDFSMYELEELHEIETELANEIKEREGNLVRITAEAENEIFEDMEEVRYEF